jgi:hypothetical protein
MLASPPPAATTAAGAAQSRALRVQALATGEPKTAAGASAFLGTTSDENGAPLDGGGGGGGGTGGAGGGGLAEKKLSYSVR